MAKKSHEVGKKNRGMRKKNLVAELSLRDQYDVIREDILRLRDDLQKGYHMAKVIVEKKGIPGQFLRSR